MSHLTTCPQCGNQLLSDTPDARCPYCLLQLGLNSPAVSEEGFVRCPSEEQLRLLVEGALPELEAASVREHVQVCPDCELRSNALRHAVRTGANRAGMGPAVVGLPQTRSVHFASPDDLTVCTPSNQLPDESIPGYQILQEIHRGGQGVVYQAIQKSTKRRVAIKVMREGPFAGPHERSRFEREVQILAALQHPHIVAVHDSGVASGNFYFAMDYISGDVLDRYVEQHDLSVEDALRLFAKVCEAMNAAHLRGIIHRDLKPANIRVDPDGEPHILDFGLARVGLGSLTADSRPQMMTMTGDFVGSPPWAAPEQAEGLPHLIDVRTDVYALGVILFQVLTGEFPYDVTGNILDVLERVRHAEPVRPSTLRRGIGDEVETIILKCLAKDRERRYQSAGEVARDINRYLAGEPIEAKRDSTMYMLKKNLRRYRIPVAVATAFVALLAVSLVISVSLWYRAQRNFRAAEEGQKAAEEARNIADIKTKEAEANAREAKRRLYSRLITLAQHALEGDCTQLKGLLEQCPVELRGWEWYRLKRLADRSRMTITAHEGPLMMVALSADGIRMASVGESPMLRLWDVPQYTLLHELSRPDDRGQCVAFSPTGDLIAFLTEAGVLEVWDVSAWQPLWALDLGADAGRGTTLFSSVGNRVAVAGDSGVIFVRNADTGEELQMLTGHSGHVNSLAYSGDGRWLASSSWDGTIRIWDAVTGEALRTLECPGTRVFGIAFSPDSQRLASACEDKTIHVWGFATGEKRLVLRGHALSVNQVAFSPDGLHLCSGGRDATLRLWDATTGAELSVLRGHSRSVKSVAFSPDGKSIVSVAQEPSIKIWDSAPVGDEREIPVLEGEPHDLAFDADSKRLFATAEGVVCVWDIASGRRVETTGAEFDPRLYSLDRRHRIRFDALGALSIEEVATHRATIIRGGTSRFIEAIFSPDGRSVATRNFEGELQIWDVASGRLLRSVEVDFIEWMFTPAFAYSPDGKRIVTCRRGGDLLQWDAETLQMVEPTLGHPNGIGGAAFTADGRRIVTAGFNDVRVWDVETGEMVAAFDEPRDCINAAVAISSNGRFLAVGTSSRGSSNPVIKIWEAADPASVKDDEPAGMGQVSVVLP